LTSESLVSIHVLAYNHGNFIKEALYSILDQITDFDFDVLVCDDASTDNTSEIVENIKKEHLNGHRIQYFRHNTNIGMINNAIFVTEKTKTKYIAICEADDYWTDNLKLQKQVDFLENYTSCSMCFHPVKCLNLTDVKKSYIKVPSKNLENYKNIYSVKDIIILGGGAIATNSIVLRSDCIGGFKEWIKIAKVGDLPLILLLALNGNIGYLNDIMSVYRIANPNSWTGNYFKSLKNRLIINNSILHFWIKFNNYTKFKFIFYIIYPLTVTSLSNLKIAYVFSVSKLRTKLNFICV
jgi:glycosyltransferase involved in cell wall biosynthesis